MCINGCVYLIYNIPLLTQKSMWVWSRNTTIINSRPIHGTARLSQRTQGIKKTPKAIRTPTALTRVRKCVSSSEPSLFAYGICDELLHDQEIPHNHKPQTNQWHHDRSQRTQGIKKTAKAIRAPKALRRVRKCASSSEPSHMQWTLCLSYKLF